MSKITDLAERLGEEIESDPAFVRYRAAKEKHDEDAELQDLIGNFNLKKMAVINLSGSENRDEARLEQLQQELQAAYDDVLRNPVMAEYNLALQETQKIVGEVYGILSRHINGPDDSSCSGSCATCSGCH